MIIQADDYEQAQPGQDLAGFFKSTEGVFVHPQVKAWDAELRRQREARLENQDGGGDKGK